MKTNLPKQILFLFFLILPYLNHAQATLIPDGDFEGALISLGIDTDGFNGQILNADAIGVTYLDVQLKGISDLTGIAAFLNLDTLICYNNQLDTLDLSSNTALTYVECSRNSIDSLNVSNCLNLKHLHCEGNSLDYLDVTALLALEELLCGVNNLSNLDVSNNSLLRYLNCSSTHIYTLDITNNTALEILYCPHNQLSTIDLSNNLMLSNLHCGSNQITNLDLSNNTALRFLISSFNPLNTLELTNNTILETLACVANLLDSLDLSQNSLLRGLACSSNNLNHLDLFLNPALTDLSCSHNQLNHLNLDSNVNITHLNCSYNQITELDLSNNTLLWQFSCDNNQLSDLDLSNNYNLNLLFCKSNQLIKLILPSAAVQVVWCYDNLYNTQICVLDVAAALAKHPNAWRKDPSATYTSDCFPESVVGRVAIDNNNNCIVDSIEVGLLTQLIQFEGANDTLLFSTHDTFGHYITFLDTGLYTVSVIKHPLNIYWNICPISQQVTIDTNYTLQTLDWSLQDSIPCTLLQVDISAPFLRNTAQGSYYTVSYCNQGTIPSNNTSIKVEIDPFLTVLSTSLPINNQIGTTYTFNVGNLDVGECDRFTIQVLVDTTANFGQTHCTKATISPDTICIPNYWNGANIEATAQCLNDTVFFFLENIGASMLQNSNYQIFENDTLITQGTFQLNGGTNQVFEQAASVGKTYRMIAYQESGFPYLLGDTFTTAFIEGCKPYALGLFDIGYATQFSNGNRAPFSAIDCQQSVGAYDPNDKTPQPVGYDDNQHYIHNYTDLDYKIRFQNTGTDTAFNIIILDTISPYLDIKSIVMGSSSHAYTWTILNDNVLSVSFSNILLPDSTTNEVFSHGFFKYHIQQKPNNPAGTLIYNSASIYFDYNPPIKTNTTWHTVSNNFINILLSNKEKKETVISLLVYPMPFSNTTNIEISGKVSNNLTLDVYDLLGRAQRSNLKFENNKLVLKKGNLPAGIYLIRIFEDRELLTVGKIIVQ